MWTSIIIMMFIFVFLMKIISYILFLFGVVITSSALYVLVFWDVFSFDRFKIRTAQQNLKIGHGEYVKASSVDDTVIAVALANMRLWNSTYQVATKSDDVFWLMNQQRALLSVDILSMLKQDDQTNKQTLETHIRHMQFVIEKTEQQVVILQERAQTLLNESNACLTTKRAWDQDFFVGLQGRDGWKMNQWLTQSLSYAPCYITKRIEANASHYLASYLSSLHPLLVQRKNILSANAEKLLTYNGLFEGTVLDELQAIKKQVVAINMPTSTDMDQVFSFWKFDQNTTLPSYNLNTLWFPGWKNPTFQEPWIDIKTSAF